LQQLLFSVRAIQYTVMWSFSFTVDKETQSTGKMRGWGVATGKLRGESARKGIPYS